MNGLDRIKLFWDSSLLPIDAVVRVRCHAANELAVKITAKQGLAPSRRFDVCRSIIQTVDAHPHESPRDVLQRVSKRLL